MPHVGINPHRSKPSWPAYLGLAVLVAVTVCIVVLALAR
jgi:hypothetical protein